MFPGCIRLRPVPAQGVANSNAVDNVTRNTRNWLLCLVCVQSTIQDSGNDRVHHGQRRRMVTGLLDCLSWTSCQNGNGILPPHSQSVTITNSKWSWKHPIVMISGYGLNIQSHPSLFDFLFFVLRCWYGWVTGRRSSLNKPHATPRFLWDPTQSGLTVEKDQLCKKKLAIVVDIVVLLVVCLILKFILCIC